MPPEDDGNAKRDDNIKEEKKIPANRSHIKQLFLREKVAGGRGANTTVSVLKPVMWIERTDNKEFYRIVCNFDLQVKIHAFEKGCQKKHAKLFDFISLRYLYHGCEWHEIKPGADAAAKFKATDETTNSKWYELGLAPATNPVGVSLAAQVHVGRDNKLTYERSETDSWRQGLSFESYKPCEHTHENAYPGIRSDRVGPHHHYHNFQADNSHNRPCWCPRSLDDPKAACPFRTSVGSRRYDRCAHWFWQTEASAHSWTPEIYESYCTPLTVVRIIPTSWFGDKHELILEKGPPYVHFDFTVTTQLRELGWASFMDYLKLSSRSSKPAEVRAKKDFGYPIAPERVTFCVWACASRIKWPKLPTMDMQKATEETLAKDPKAREVPDSTKYFKDKKEEEKKKEKAEKMTEGKVEVKVEIQTPDVDKTTYHPKIHRPRHYARHYHHRHGHRHRHEYSPCEGRSTSPPCEISRTTCDCHCGEYELTPIRHPRDYQVSSHFCHEHNLEDCLDEYDLAESDSDGEMSRGRHWRRSSPHSHHRYRYRCACRRQSPSSGSSVNLSLSESDGDSSPVRTINVGKESVCTVSHLKSGKVGVDEKESSLREKKSEDQSKNQASRRDSSIHLSTGEHSPDRAGEDESAEEQTRPNVVVVEHQVAPDLYIQPSRNISGRRSYPSHQHQRARHRTRTHSHERHTSRHHHHEEDEIRGRNAVFVRRARSLTR